jgi:PAS domain-containing protein
MAQREVELVLMRHLAIHLKTPLLLTDDRGDLLFFNEAAEPVLGRRFAETGAIRRGEWSATFKPTWEDGAPMKREDQPLFIATDHREPVHRSMGIEGLDGVRRRIEAVAFPLVGQGDRMLGAAAIFWEPRDRPRAARSPPLAGEPRPRRREVEVILMRQLASCLAMPIVLVDPDGALLFFNEPAEPIFGRRFDETEPLSPEEWAAAIRALREDGSPLEEDERPMMVALREQRPVHRRFSLLGLDGVRRTVEGISFPLVGRAQRTLAAVAIFWEALRP